MRNRNTDYGGGGGGEEGLTCVVLADLQFNHMLEPAPLPILTVSSFEVPAKERKKLLPSNLYTITNTNRVPNFSFSHL